jgi:hypothetical protein
VEGSTVIEDNEEIFLFSWFFDHPKLVGWGLIALGLLVVFQRQVVPYISYEFRSLFQTVLVAVILIGSGIKLLLGTRDKKMEGGMPSCDKEE